MSDYKQTCKYIEELKKYTEYEQNELGEAWIMLCEIHNRGDYLSEHFKNAVRKEIKDQLEYVKKHTKIVKEKRDCCMCTDGKIDVVDLVWDNI